MKRVSDLLHTSCTRKSLPLQNLPSPSNPLLQRHTYEPSVFVHTAFMSQLLDSGDSHSLISARTERYLRPVSTVIPLLVYSGNV